MALQDDVLSAVEGHKRAYILSSGQLYAAHMAGGDLTPHRCNPNCPEATRYGYNQTKSSIACLKADLILKNTRKSEFEICKDYMSRFADFEYTPSGNGKTAISYKQIDGITVNNTIWECFQDRNEAVNFVANRYIKDQTKEIVTWMAENGHIDEIAHIGEVSSKTGELAFAVVSKETAERWNTPDKEKLFEEYMSLWKDFLDGEVYMMERHKIKNGEFALGDSADVFFGKQDFVAELGNMERDGANYLGVAENLDDLIGKRTPQQEYAASCLREVIAKREMSKNNDYVRDWYMRVFEDDNLGESIEPSLTFENMKEQLIQGYDAYDILGVRDSLVRERVFDKFADENGVTYQDVMDLWHDPTAPNPLKGDMSEIEV